MIATILVAIAYQQGSNGCQPLELEDPTPVTNGAFAQPAIYQGSTVDRAAIGSAVSGEVLVFSHPHGQPWALEQTISGPSYGFAAAIWDDTLAIGRNGSVDTYRLVGGVWSMEQTIVAPPSIGSSSKFGFSGTVDMYDERMIIGAPDGDTPPTVNQGAAFIYERIAGVWTEIRALHLTPGVNFHLHPDRSFGRGVAICSDYAVVGNPQDIQFTSIGSSFFIFSAADMYAQGRVILGDGNNKDTAGFDVDCSGQRLIIGQITSDTAATDAGKAEVWRNTNPPLASGWVLDGVLIPSDIGAGDNVGVGVAIKGNTAYVGGRFHDHGGTDTGGVWVFKREGGSWVQKIELGPALTSANDLFGERIEIDGDLAIVTSLRGDPGDAGRGYIFDIVDCPLQGP